MTRLLLAMLFVISCSSHQSSSKLKRGLASDDVYTPQDAVSDALSSKLVFKYYAQLPGAGDSVGSCVFANDKVLVVYNACLRSKKEAPATNIDIISFDGGMVSFYIENSERAGMKGKNSQLRREDYDGNWRVSFAQTNSAFRPEMSMSELRSYYVANYGVLAKSSCYVGGTLVSNPIPRCKGRALEIQDAWGASAAEFWAQPDENWYTFQKLMRSEIASQYRP